MFPGGDLFGAGGGGVKVDQTATSGADASGYFGAVGFSNPFLINATPGGIDGAVQQAVMLIGLGLVAWVAVQYLKSR